jgi:hypothetical protein
VPDDVEPVDVQLVEDGKCHVDEERNRDRVELGGGGLAEARGVVGQEGAPRQSGELCEVGVLLLGGPEAVQEDHWLGPGGEQCGDVQLDAVDAQFQRLLGP